MFGVQVSSVVHASNGGSTSKNAVRQESPVGSVSSEPTGIKRYAELLGTILVAIAIYPFIVVWHYKERAFERTDETRAGE